MDITPRLTVSVPGMFCVVMLANSFNHYPLLAKPESLCTSNSGLRTEIRQENLRANQTFQETAKILNRDVIYISVRELKCHGRCGIQWAACYVIFFSLQLVTPFKAQTFSSDPWSNAISTLRQQTCSAGVTYISVLTPYRDSSLNRLKLE